MGQLAWSIEWQRQERLLQEGTQEPTSNRFLDLYTQAAHQ